jgi:hypothetical protein
MKKDKKQLQDHLKDKTRRILEKLDYFKFTVHSNYKLF